ncbi:hypothetical protein ACD578_27545 (plasmid) [Microvirga sp. RSM25]|uniref:hypothetical protein n=1 Tax=Microvirga sp. RSM25 TaxID=3273802 RepID=UPI00384AF2AD
MPKAFGCCCTLRLPDFGPRHTASISSNSIRRSSAFLEHTEEARGNSARPRNLGFAAIHSSSASSNTSSVLPGPSPLGPANPTKKADEALVSHLPREEMQALLDAPNPRQVSGIRDRAMPHLAFEGPRVSEFVSLRLGQIDRQAAASIHVMGKCAVSARCRSERRQRRR